MYEFMILISQYRTSPIKAATTGIKEIIHNNISPSRTILDNGTATRFVSKKLGGN